ncbi:MAG: helix-turn-helix transcriptional regulator [Clostridia bacterium]|nr:helix-turn-helix transcriptional regulator [Clostridia bacterium]
MQEPTLGALIAEKRRERHLTQAELAAHFGISDKAVSKWERNLSKPEEKIMPQLVALLDLPQGYLSHIDATRSSGGRGARILHLVRREFLRIAATAALLALGISVALGNLSVEQAMPPVAISTALFALATLCRGGL